MSSNACPSCGNTNIRLNAKFCRVCGSSLVSPMSNFGSNNPAISIISALNNEPSLPMAEMVSLKQLVENSSSYVQIFRKQLETANPYWYEQIIGGVFQGIVKDWRLERLNSVLSQIENLKNHSKDVLGQAIAQASTILADANRLNKLAIGTIARDEPRFELTRRNIIHLIQTCRRSIEFVKKHANQSFPANYIGIELSQIKPETIKELEKLPLHERVKIQEEWRLFVSALHEFDLIERSIAKAKADMNTYLFVEKFCEHYLRICQEELNLVNERFDYLALLIRTQKLAHIEGFFSQKIKENSLNHFVHELDNMETTIMRLEK